MDKKLGVKKKPTKKMQAPEERLSYKKAKDDESQSNSKSVKGNLGAFGKKMPA